MVKICSNVSWNKIGDTVYIINEKNCDMFELVDVSSVFWMEIYEQKKDIFEIISYIAKYYNENIEDVQTDIMDLYNQFLEEGLLLEV